MATSEEISAAQTELLKAIAKHAGQTAYAEACRNWAEAYAWVTSPNNSHGGSGKVNVSS